jgi:hypothetical protein
MLKSIPLIAILLLTSCSTRGPIGTFSKVPYKHKKSCVKICKDLKMDLGGMVVVSNSAGCVCEVRKKKVSKRASASAISGAITAIMQAEAARKAAQQSVPK